MNADASLSMDGPPSAAERACEDREPAQAQAPAASGRCVTARTPTAAGNGGAQGQRETTRQPNSTARSNPAPDKAARRARLVDALTRWHKPLPNRRYGVIVADPPWRFEPWSRTTGMDRAADNHYVTQPLAAIKALDVPSIAADDAVLALWATVPMLLHALEVMAAWGFGYRSNFVWIKDRIGTGYWNRNRHELCLIGRRGHVAAPLPGQRADSVLEAPRARHSAKPEAFLEIFERYFPDLPKIELYRRGSARPGWDAWGHEAAD
jgi:N6-adenosine-specific RNA methylase IME4